MAKKKIQESDLDFLNINEDNVLKSPFEDGCVSEIIKDINSYLESIDDSIL